jgi:hypothetical protein
MKAIDGHYVRWHSSATNTKTFYVCRKVGVCPLKNTNIFLAEDYSAIDTEKHHPK